MGTRTYSRRGVLTRLGRERAERQGAPAGVAAQRPSGVNLEQEMYSKSLSELVTIGAKAERANDFDRAYAAYSELANKRLAAMPGAAANYDPVIYDEQPPKNALQSVLRATYQAFDAFKAIDLDGVPMEEAAKVAQFFAVDIVDIIKRAQSNLVTADRLAERGLDTYTQYDSIAQELA